MGFSQILRDKDYDKAHYVKSKLMEETSVETNKLFPNFELTIETFAISDDIVSVSRADGHHAPGSVFYELARISYAQLSLILESIPVRGGITIGEMCLGPKDSRSPMGEALGWAYKIEQTTKPPIMGIDFRLIEKFLRSSELHSHEENLIHWELGPTLPMIFSLDEKYFLNYLYIAFDDFPDVGAISNIRRHKEIIEKALSDYADNSKVLRKYTWLRDYHNAFLEWIVRREKEYPNSKFLNHFGPCQIDNLIDLKIGTLTARAKRFTFIDFYEDDIRPFTP